MGIWICLHIQFSVVTFIFSVICNNQPMPYLSLIVQMKMMMVVKIFLKTKLFAEYALLNWEKVVTPSRWNVAVKVNLH